MYNIWEKAKDKIKRIRKISWIKFIHYNFFCTSVIRDKKCYMITYKNSQIEIHRTAKIILHANFSINSDKILGSKAECIIRLRENSTFTIFGAIILCSDTTIDCHQNGKLSIGSAFVNCGSVIICEKEISIGNEFLMARNGKIYDTDYHKIISQDGKVTNLSRRVLIEDHVWLGINCIVMKGSTIRKDAVVGAGTIIKGEVESGKLAFTQLTQHYKDVHWQA